MWKESTPMGDNTEKTGDKLPTTAEMITEKVEHLREYASELQREVAKQQAEIYEAALLRLMERTGDNLELVNNLRDFINALEHRANFGYSEDPIGKSSQENLAKFFEEVAKALRWTVTHGNRPTDLKIDLSEWEAGK